MNVAFFSNMLKFQINFWKLWDNYRLTVGRNSRGFRDDSVVKKASYCSRQLRFNSQHSHTAQNHLNSSFSGLNAFSWFSLDRSCSAQTYMYAKHSYMNVSVKSMPSAFGLCMFMCEYFKLYNFTIAIYFVF